MPPMPTSPLFPDDYLAALGRLSLDLSPAPASALVGGHLSPRAGASIQFRDFAPYAQGDDLRRIDWNVYARTRHLFVRRFDHPAAAPVSVLVDDSPSMRLGTPGRSPTAARLAAAVAAAAVTGRDPAQVMIGTTPPRPAFSGRPGLARLLTDLAAPRPPTRSGLAATITAALPRLSARGRGLLVVISDFFDDAGPAAIAAALARHGGRLLCLRLTDPADLRPDWSAADDLIDCETADRLALPTVGHDALAAGYVAAYRTYFADLDGHLSRRGARSVVCDVADPPLDTLARLFTGGTLKA